MHKAISVLAVGALLVTLLGGTALACPGILIGTNEDDKMVGTGGAASDTMAALGVAPSPAVYEPASARVPAVLNDRVVEHWHPTGLMAGQLRRSVAPLPFMFSTTSSPS